MLRVASDIDECKEMENHSCRQKGQRCVNTYGSYVCECGEGWTSDESAAAGSAANESFCVDIDECEIAGMCHGKANCTNTDGSYQCNCNNDYTGNGTHCQGRNDIMYNDESTCQSSTVHAEVLIPAFFSSLVSLLQICRVLLQICTVLKLLLFCLPSARSFSLSFFSSLLLLSIFAAAVTNVAWRSLLVRLISIPSRGSISGKSVTAT